jgi:hypothetical protein
MGSPTHAATSHSQTRPRSRKNSKIISTTSEISQNCTIFSS